MVSYSQCFAPFPHILTMNQLSGTDFFLLSRVLNYTYN